MSTPAMKSSHSVFEDMKRIFVLQQAQQWRTKATTAAPTAMRSWPR